MAVTGASAKAPARSDDEIRNSVLLELKWDPFWDFSVQPLCSLCLCGVVLLGIHQPQRHREHRGCTEKSAIETFCAKAGVI